MLVGARFLAAAVTAIALSLGCAAPAPLIVRGEALTTGNTTYDDFFVAVRQARSEAIAAATDEEASHAGLMKALGLEAAAKRAAAVDASAQRAKKLSESGVLVHLEIAPEARILTARAKAELGADGEAMLRAVEEAARSSQEMRKRFAAVAARAAELQKRRVELLAKAMADFREHPPAKREQVVLELDATKAVLDDAVDKANLAAGAAARFVLDLAAAVETGAEEAAAKSAKAGPGKRSAMTLQPLGPSSGAVAAAPAAKAAAAPHKGAGAPAKAAAAPAKAAAAPAAPPPKKKAKGGDDFEP